MARLNAAIADWLRQPGYPALFAVSLLASSLLPLGSEWLLALMLTQGYQPTTTVAVATLGNTLGACTTWAVGSLQCLRAWYQATPRSS